ncbi:hypothetical protein VTO73DRAFT_14331 [Trametes versicolor]
MKASEEPPAPTEASDRAAEEKAARKAAKKAAAAERAAERARISQEKAAVRAVEKERLAKEKAAEKEKQAVLKAEKEKAAKEKAEKEKAEREKAARERAERELAAKERAEKEAADRAERERAAEAQRAAKAAKQAASAKAQSSASPTAATPTDKTGRKVQATKPAVSSPGAPERVEQAPILARMPKKNKPVTKPIKIPKEDNTPDAASTLPSAATSDAPQLPEARAPDSSSNNSRAHSVDIPPVEPMSIKDMFQELHVQFPWLGLSKHPFFDLQKINPASKVPLEYGPLVHALSALSVGGGSFANNMPSTSIDNAVSSFQQLLETLTQTISDLLRLLPRTTWDDSSSFDGVLRDMLKGDDFLDDGGDDQNGQGKEDEVAALTLALERRARWMEVQLSKLEELHRDINTAAVRAILSFNDNGWDPSGSLPRLGHTLSRFDQIGLVSAEDGEQRLMSADELEKKLGVAKEAAQFVEAELREVMQSLQGLRPTDDYEDF